MSFAEDLADFIHDDTPGYRAAVLVVGTATSTVGGIYDSAYEAALTVLAGRNPSLLVTDASLGAAKRGDAITVAGTPYVIQNLEPDGTGLTRLQLGAA